MSDQNLLLQCPQSHEVIILYYCLEAFFNLNLEFRSLLHPRIIFLYGVRQALVLTSFSVLIQLSSPRHPPANL
jgi:hypothetical protein